MLADALNTLSEWIIKSQQPRVVRTSADQAYIAFPDGKFHEVNFEPPAEAHQLETMQSFLDAVTLRGIPEQEGGDAADQSAIFLSKSKALLVVKLGDRQQSLEMPLREAPQFTALRGGFRRDKPLDQRSLLELLRHDLFPHAPENLINLARKVDATSHQRGVSEVSAGRERGTLEFQAEIRSEVEIPERVQFHLPVFEGDRLDSKQWVDCSFRVTLPPGPVTFLIEPYPGEIERAYEQALLAIHAVIAEECSDIPVLRGTTDLWRPGSNGFFVDPS